MPGKRWLLIAALWILIGPSSISCRAQEADAEPAGDAPSMALLEFLGEWETPDGEWFDPMEFEPWSLDMDFQEDENDDAR